jgi:hypothetical protein
MRFLTTLLGVLGLLCTVSAQTTPATIQPSQLVLDYRNSGQPLNEFSLLRTAAAKRDKTDLTDQLDSELSAYQLFDLNAEVLQQLLAETPAGFTFVLPAEKGQSKKIDLVRVNVFSDGPMVRESETNAWATVDEGIHYRGVIRGVEGSVAALSFFDNEVMGLLASPATGNLVLGKVQSAEKDGEAPYVLYEDYTLRHQDEFLCGTPDDGPGYTAEELEDPLATRNTGDCVKIYFEVDNDIFVQKGSTAAVTTYVTGLFNQVAALYAAESVNLVISEIYVWTTPSPYQGTSSYTLLTQFQTTRTSFNGNLAQLLSYKASGGIAVLNGLCHPYSSARMSFASIASSYSAVPTYSWTVMVVAHELGHLLGSHHTHACVWNGNNTAIDGCAGVTEGGCPNPGIPSGGGTIMSYCHLTNTGINLTKGFGSQPGAVIRSRVAAATCTQACSTGGGGGGGGNPPAPACTQNTVYLTLTLDNYGPETSWKLKNSVDTVLFSGGPYPKGIAGTIIRDTFCLPNGCYKFAIMDSYGDGMCCNFGQGAYLLKDAAGNTLASGGSFASEQITQVCLPVPTGGGGGNANCVTINDFTNVPILSFGGNQDGGSYTLLNTGTVLRIQNNAWKAIALPYNVKSNTVIQFDFGSTIEGEIHGIGFDEDNLISFNRTFKVHGTQSWGITNYDNYPGGSVWKTYIIPIGQFYTGNFNYLFFASDQDVAPYNGNSFYRNIKIYDGAACNNLDEGDNSVMLPESGPEALLVYPNPARESLQVRFRVQENSSTANLSIFNATGQLVQTRSISTLNGEQLEQVDVHNLPQGAYFVKISSDQGTASAKFTVVR